MEPKGYVETPTSLVNLMVEKLFKHGPPFLHSRVLIPGCGKGTFIDGIIRWCHEQDVSIPRLLGVELNEHLALEAKRKYVEYPMVTIENDDFLEPSDSVTALEKYDFIIGNPPYVSINQIQEEDRRRYRALYQSAKRRFDLYMLFFERALRCLKLNGRLVFITPEKFLYVETAEQFRKLLSSKHIEEVHLLDEGVFGKIVAYPAVTTVVNQSGNDRMYLILRDGLVSSKLSSTGSSWLPNKTPSTITSEHVLGDICDRISCGVATGADSVFVKKNG